MTRLRECRENARLSQKYVAISLGVSAPSVANWERGKTNPTHENIVKLADLYGVSVDYLLGRTDKENKTVMNENDICSKHIQRFQACFNVSICASDMTCFHNMLHT